MRVTHFNNKHNVLFRARLGFFFLTANCPTAKCPTAKNPRDTWEAGKEKPHLYLGRVQVHGNDLVGAGFGQHVCHQLCGNGGAGLQRKNLKISELFFLN